MFVIFRSLSAALQFYRYFTNVEIQEKLVSDAQERIPEPLNVEAREVCREVLRAMVMVSGAMELSLSDYMEMVDISTGVLDVLQGKVILIL